MVMHHYSITQINRLFQGKSVEITSSENSSLHDGSGICHSFHSTKSGIYMKLVDGRRWDFMPDNVTSAFIEGSVGISIKGRIKIELITT